MRKIYIASSWRNQHQNSVVRACRGLGHQVYDFKNPSDGNHGFSWSQIDPNWKNWNARSYIEEAINHPISNAGFKSDMDALRWCDTCILLLPCGRSAHLEAGYCVGAEKDTFVFVANEKFEPDLMYKMCKLITDDIDIIYKNLGQSDAS